MDCRQTCIALLESMSKRVDVRDRLSAIKRPMPNDPAPDYIEVLPAHPVEGIDEATIPAPERTVPLDRRAFALTDEQKDRIDRLPRKVGEKYRALLQTGVAQIAAEKVGQGINPFGNYGHRFLWTACELLLAGGFNQATLRSTYMTKYGWSEGTAFARASMAVSIFKILDLVTEREGILVVNPNIKRDTNA